MTGQPNFLLLGGLYVLRRELGSEADFEGTRIMRTHRGASGHPLYGPYVTLRPGRYQVEFRLALADGSAGTGDEVCAVIDVTSHWGCVFLASRQIRTSELTGALTSFFLEFSAQDVRAFEYRIAVNGSRALLIGIERRHARLGDVAVMAPVEVDRDTSDPVELQQMVRAVLKPLRPYGVAGFQKVRMGNIADGGYVMIDDFAGIETAFSLGINDDITWDIDAAARGLTIYQFDHTVDDPAPDDPRMIFERKMITTRSGPDSQSLPDLVRKHDKGLARPNLMLKMDIELHEWDVVNDMDAALLGRFSQIVCELHYFQGLGEDGMGTSQAEWRRRIHAALTKLDQHYFVGHVHANSVGGTSVIANVFVPNVLEVTYLNRAIYQPVETDEIFPGPLDASCDGNQPDIFLGAFRY